MANSKSAANSSVTVRMKVLLVEDDPVQILLLERVLVDSYDLTVCTSVEMAKQACRSGGFDLFLLDVGLPDGNGLDFGRWLRSQDRFLRVPILYLTSRADLEAKKESFILGADDYLTKPVSPQELVLRLEHRARKSLADQVDVDPHFRAGPLLLNLKTQSVQIQHDGHANAAQLNTIEFKLLVQLTKNLGQEQTKQSLLTSVWGADTHFQMGSVDSTVTAIRQKLGPCAWCIQEVDGSAYKFTIVRGASNVAAKK